MRFTMIGHLHVVSYIQSCAALPQFSSPLLSVDSLGFANIGEPSFHLISGFLHASTLLHFRQLGHERSDGLLNGTSYSFKNQRVVQT